MDADRSTRPSVGPDRGLAPAEAGDGLTVLEGDPMVVRVRGDVDAVSAPALRSALLDIVERRPGSVRVDMSAVAFLDSVGISVLVSAHNRATDAGVGFELASVPVSSLRVLEITRLTEVFTIIA